MKLTTVCSRLHKRSTTRFPNMEHYKYDYYRDPLLKDKVSGAVCVEEMTLMLNCLKNSEFDERPCTQLIDSFKGCVQMAEARRKKSKELRKSGVIDTANEEQVEAKKRLPATVVTQLLRRFPEPK